MESVRVLQKFGDTPPIAWAQRKSRAGQNEEAKRVRVKPYIWNKNQGKSLFFQVGAVMLGSFSKPGIFPGPVDHAAGSARIAVSILSKSVKLWQRT